MKSDFVTVRKLDNFYQTSSFYPMPVVLVSTLAETGQTNLGPYSLCFPHIIAGKHSMMLISRADSNTSLNIQRTGVCALSFIPDRRKYTKNCVVLGYPGETTSEKMQNSIFTLIDSTRTEEERQPDTQYPDIVREAIQVFECTWNRDHPLSYSPDSIENHFVLTIDKIVMQERWRDRMFKGKGFPRLPIDYGYRNNTKFWFTRGPRPYAVPIPKSKAITVDAVQYAADRIDPDIAWQRDACAKLVKVPRVFLTRVLTQCAEAAKEEGIAEITPEFLDRVRDRRNKDRGNT